MAQISAQAVKDLRDRTGAGMMDCKRALADAGGDVERAVSLLRERGLAKAGKREGRATHEGVIAVALRGDRGGILELGCETDFVARTDDFQKLAGDLAGAVAETAALADPEALLGAHVEGAEVRERIQQTMARLGENVEVKRAERLAVEGKGAVGGYVHAGGKLGVLVALSTEAPDAAGELAKDLAMHVAAADPTPLAVDAEGIPAEVLEAERAIYARQAEQSGKPENVVAKIVEGRVRKYVKEVALLEQPFVKDPDRSVGDLLGEFAKSHGPARVEGFRRFRLGEAPSA